MSDRERERLHFLADLTPAHFPVGRTGHASTSAAIERAVADAKFAEIFCKREIDLPAIKNKEPEYFEQLCETRRLAGELLDAYGRGRNNGQVLNDRAVRRIIRLYDQMSASIKSLFWIADTTPMDEKPLWRLCCQRL